MFRIRFRSGGIYLDSLFGATKDLRRVVKWKIFSQELFRFK